MNRNVFVGKIKVNPRGIVAVREGLGIKKKQTLSPPCQSLRTSRMEDARIASDFPSSPDVPYISPLRPGWGLLGNKPHMSHKTSQNALDRLAAIELKVGRGNCLFVTLTIPSISGLAFEMLARYSSYSVNRLNQWLKDNYGGDNFARVCVWEYQKRGAPHLHMAIGCLPEFGMAGDNQIIEDKEGSPLQSFRHRLAIAWMQCLESIEEMSGIPMFESGRRGGKERLLNYSDLGKRFCNVQVVKKSIAAYLGSYLAGSNHDKNSLRKYFAPIATWAQWDRKATAWMHEFSLEFDAPIYAENYEDWEDLKKILFGAFELAPDTEIKDHENHFWTSRTAIAKHPGNALMSIARDWIGLFRESGIVARFFDVFKFKKKKTGRKDWQLEADMHDLDFDNYLAKKELADSLIVPMCWDILNMYCLIEEIMGIMEAQQYSHNEQIRLF